MNGKNINDSPKKQTLVKHEPMNTIDGVTELSVKNAIFSQKK